MSSPDKGSHPRVQLSLRLDRPIEACELQPRAYLFIKGIGAALNNTMTAEAFTSSGSTNDPKLMADPAISKFDLSEPHYFKFRWLRGPERQVCANPSCPRARSFSPVDWSKRARSGHRLQCVCCLKLNLPRHSSIFCTPKCFQEAWQSHKFLHVVPETPRNKFHSISQEDLVEEVEKKVELEEEGVEEGYDENDGETPCSKNNIDVVYEDEEWVEIANGTSALYTPTKIDAGHCLRLECRAFSSLTDTLLCPPRVITTEPVLSAPPIPPKRALVAVKGAGGGGGARFRIISYNILAEIYATQQMYPHIDFWALNWTYRKHNLLRELLESSADILCLQEVQADHYEQHLIRPLQEAGYDGLYKPKTRDCMGILGKVDGCALLWRRQKFRLAENYAIEFNECARRACVSLGLSPEHSSVFLRRLCKDNIAQVAVLEVLQNQRQRGRSPSHICIANTHIYSHPEFPDVKLWQAHTLMQELEHFVLSRNLPLMVLGDFNSLPSSAVYEYMSKQCVSHNHPDMDNDPCHVLPNVEQLTHNIQLSSAYAAVQGHEPPYTIHTGTFTGVLDYIWFAQPHIRPLAVSPVPDLEEVLEIGEAMPNCLHSSDHALLSCDVQLGGGLTLQS
jgi:CCR4-NOT transcription complex subunit 6